MDILFIKNNITKYLESYDYLINMTFKQLTNINLLKLENKLNIIEDELRKIRKLTNKNIWIQDLNELTLYLTK
jgi:hypothetical protein